MSELLTGAKYILKILNNNGYQGFIVGGYVRDLLLKRASTDIDITTNALPKDIKRLFKITVDTGIKHGTVTVILNKATYEVTTFRQEEEYFDSRRPSKVIFVSDLNTDLSRRDFTINAMALDSNGTIIDPFDGRKDLQSHLIKTVGFPNDRFKEDALRMLRAIRFSSQLGFSIDSNTLTAIRQNARTLSNLPIERVMSELAKLISGKNANKALNYLKETKLDQYIYGIDKGVSCCIEFNVEGISLEQFLAICKMFNQGIEVRKWKLSNKSNTLIKNIAVLSDKSFDICDSIIIYKYGKETCLIANKIRMSLYGEDDQSIEIDNIASNIRVNRLSDLAVTGDEIKAMFPNEKAGSWIGQILQDILYEVLKGNIENNFDEIKDYVLKKY